ncbi:V-type ATP synthase subunit F [Haloimpatiens massiliensis]|uniref:V-type ATP synthase subunit F n=1 Tax=Haloimpatiens massiliensis TaxID=1658110 RepID=UPI000C8616B1|nr:V-type ATP synthase subunit F [Haloimpatiens massiliensis]
MKAYLISDNRDTYKGLNIAGINGVVAHSKEEVLNILSTLLQDRTIGIIIFTEKIVDMIPEKIDTLKISKGLPLIVEIPDRHGSTREKNIILKYVKESIGINL